MQHEKPDWKVIWLDRKVCIIRTSMGDGLDNGDGDDSGSGWSIPI